MILTELNKIAVWRPIVGDKLDVKEMSEYPHLVNGSKKVGKVTRYAKNYEIDDKIFSLLVVTQNPDTSQVEKLMDSIAPTTPLDLCDGMLHKTDKLLV